METGMIALISVIGIILILNLYYFLTRMRRRDSRSRKGRGREYIPPDEKKRAEWRDREVVRRIEREQDNAMERVSLRNETLAYYEAVRQRHMKLEAMERLGLKPDEDANPEDMTDLGLDEYLNIR